MPPETKNVEGLRPHQLFLPEREDDELVFPTWISVVRVDAKGKHLDTSGGSVAASELPDVSALLARYGGGYYEVYARDARCRVMKRRIIGPLPGRPRPMTDIEIDEPEEEPKPLPPANQATDFALLLQGQREFMASLLAAQKAESTSAMERMAAAHSAQLQAQEKSTDRLLTVFTEVLRQKNEAPIQVAKELSPPNPLELFMQGAAWQQELRAETEAASGGDSIEDSLKLFVGAMEAMKPPKPPEGAGGG